MATFDPNKLVGAPQPIAPQNTQPIGSSSASSSGGPSGGGFGQTVPYLTPEDFQKFQNYNPSGYTYSVPAGGYLTNEEAQNANSYYNKFGGSDPMANQKMQELYGWLGTLPTTHAGGSAALQLFQAQHGGAGAPQLGPSINESLGAPWQGPWEIRKSRFSSTPLSGGGGPW